VQVTTRKAGPVDVSGEIDFANSPLCRSFLLREVQNNPERGVLVNLEQVPYIDSSSIASLVEGLKVSRDVACRFLLCGLGTSVREALQLSRLTKVFEVYADEQAALST
jgi:anti-anti-sigma factor